MMASAEARSVQTDTGSRAVFICPNPALDRTVSVDNLDRGVTMRASEALVDPGGKSVHAAVVAEQLFGTALLVAAFGGDTGRRAENLLTTYPGLRTATTRISSETRETWTVVPKSGGPSLELAMSAPTLDDTEIARLWRDVARSVAPTVIVGGGSLPHGIDDGFYATLTEVGRKAGALVLIDATGKALVQAVSARPYLVKPNAHEASTMLDIDLVTQPSSAIDAAVAIQERGARNVWLTLGSSGSILVTEDGRAISFPAVPAAVINTVGCGDAMMGAAAGALASGRDLPSAITLGAAAAASQAEQLSPVGIDVARVRGAVASIQPREI